MRDTVDPHPNGASLRAIVTGCFLAGLLGIAEPYVLYDLRCTSLAHHFAPLGAMLFFLVLTGLVNNLAKVFAPSHAFRSGELITIYIMLLAASAVVSWGLIGQLLPILIGARYFAWTAPAAKPEFRLIKDLIPHVPDWLTPTDPDVIRWYHEGLPPGESLPWLPWIKVLLPWSAFVALLYLVCFCLMVVLRRQWVEHERLAFPLVQLPIAMADDDPKQNVYRNTNMWLGFTIAFVLMSFVILHRYHPSFPEIPLLGRFGYLPLTRHLTLGLLISLPVIGFTFLVPTEVSLSVWVFCLVGYAEGAILNSTGWSIPGWQPYAWGGTAVTFQGAGGLFALIVVSTYIGRGHLRNVFREAVFGRSGAHDSREVSSYRFAILGLLTGLTGMATWMYLTGLRASYAVLFVPIALVILLGVTRIVCQAGLSVAKLPMTPQPFLTDAVAGTAVASPDVVSLAYTFPWCADAKGFMLPALAHGFRLVDEIRGQKRWVGLAIVLAIAVAFVTSVAATLYLMYTIGAANVGYWLTGSAGSVPFRWAGWKLQNMVEFSTSRWICFGIGATLMLVLMLLQRIFFWWPLHPIGFPLAQTLPIRYTWLSIMLAWLFKRYVLRYGGAGMYRRLVPLFYGLVLGHFTAMGFSMILALFTGQGHELYNY